MVRFTQGIVASIAALVLGLLVPARPTITAARASSCGVWRRR